MASLVDYLTEHVSGEVLEAPDILEHFSTDGSVLKLRPGVVIYPQNLSDLRKVTKFCFKLAEKGQIIPLTMRGAGTDQSGASLNDHGIILVTMPHLNKLLALDTTKKNVLVQPGLNYRNLQDTLNTHGLYLPPYPSSIDYCTIGGSVANNASGERSLKFGSTRNFVEKIEFILSNGDTIIAENLTKKQLTSKKNQDDFEGHIYRELDDLLNESHEIIATLEPETTKNSAGYHLESVKNKKGDFNLCPLIVGSQGTLGVIAAITLKAEDYRPTSTLVVSAFENLDAMHQAVQQLIKLSPVAIEIVDKNLLNRVSKISPNYLKGVIDQPFPAFVLLTEFDDEKPKKQASSAKKAESICNSLGSHIYTATDLEEREKFWKIRHSAALVLGKSAADIAGDKKAALPIIEDGCVPLDHFAEFIDQLYQLFAAERLDIAIWGHAGDGNIHIQPKMNLTGNFDRQKVIRLMDHYYKIVLDLGGTISGEHNDGRLRTPYMHQMYDEDELAIFQKIKDIFDPYHFLNPGVKFNTTKRDILYYLRHDMDNLSWQSKPPL